MSLLSSSIKLTLMCQTRHNSLCPIYTMMHKITATRKPHIKQFEVPHSISGSCKTSPIPGHVFGVLAGVGLSPIKGSSHKTENYVQISTLPPQVSAHSWPRPTQDHTILTTLLSSLAKQSPLPRPTLLNHVPSTAHLHRAMSASQTMASLAGGDGDTVMNEASTRPCCVLLQVFNYHT